MPGHSVEMFLRTYAKDWINGDRDALEMKRLESVTRPASGEVSGEVDGE